MDRIERLIQQFHLKPHPEGGYYSQGYRSSEFIRADNISNRYNGARNLYSSIHFMVTQDKFSRFHRIKTDEMWHFYLGDPMVMHLINEHGKYHFYEMSNEPNKERFQLLVKKNTWMAASTKGEFSLTGCTLAPGFEYDDFELATRAHLLENYPHLEDIILRFTNP